MRTGCLALAGWLLAAATSWGAERPNIVFLLVDDLGWADLGCYGSSFHETPHIDRLAAEGMRFTQAYAACSVCSPTRASIMTGRHPVRVDITDWIPGQNVENQPWSKFEHVADRDSLALEEVTLAELLKQVDYQTFFVGKWHLGGEGALPTDQGFDENVGGFSKGSPPGGYYAPYKNPYLPNREPGEYLTERLTEESSRLITERDRERPFFLSLCYYNVHTPIQAYRKRVDFYREKAAEFSGETPREQEREAITRLRQDNPAYASMVAAVDDSVGELMALLEREGIAEETVIFFFSDNGGLATLRRLAPTSNAPLRSGKGWLYEGGIREPLIIRAPGLTPAGSVSDQPVFSTDFFPTIAALADVEPDPQIELDGQSLIPYLRVAQPPQPRSFVWHYPHYHGSTWKPGAAIREGDWKLIEFYHWDEVELYHLGDDPGERHDLAAECPQVTARLRKKLSDWQQRMGARMPVPKQAAAP